MNSGLLVVDVQPAYHDYCSHVAKDVAKRINNTRKPTVIMWVGEGLTTDTQSDVYAYLRQHGARPHKLNECRFVEKDYGFFRSWMDRGIAQEHIVKVGKALLQQRNSHYEDLDLEAILGMSTQEVLEDANCSWIAAGSLKAYTLHRPMFDESWLHAMDQFDTCGGGRDECLSEMELFLSMHDKPFTRLEHLIY